MTDLTKQKCEACTIDAPLVDKKRFTELLKDLDGWEIIYEDINKTKNIIVIDGITTTIELHKKLLKHEKFIKSNFNVSWLDKEKII